MNENKTVCPICGGEILETAKKCRHCREWLDNSLEEEKNNENLSFPERIVFSVILFGISWALFHFGSWRLVIGKKVNVFLQYLSKGYISNRDITQFLLTGKVKQQDIIWDDNAILLRINEKYYGFVNNSHFFDSPFLQFMMLVSSIGLFIYAISALFSVNVED